MTDVLLLNSPLFRDHNPLYDEDSLPPIGLGYIATLLAEAGITVELVDAVASRLPLQDLVERINESRPAVVATNIFSTNYEFVKELVESISGYRPRVIIGGLATRTLYEMIFQWDYSGPLDVVFGDGEIITPDLVRGTVVQLPTETCGQMRFFKVDSASPYFCTDISNIPLDRSFFRTEPVHRGGR